MIMALISVVLLKAMILTRLGEGKDDCCQYSNSDVPYVYEINWNDQWNNLHDYNDIK